MACAPEQQSKGRGTSVTRKLICSICLETYNSPRALACMHTFCERCIHSYIMQETEKRPQASGIRCPVCRKETTSPAPTKPATEWAAALTVNYALLPALEPEDDVINGHKCDPCSADNKVREAMSYCQDCGEFQCEECLSAHRRFAQMKRHVFIDLDKVSAQRTAPITLGGMEFCSQHSEKSLKFFCQNHKSLCCGTCVIIEHRACTHVQEVKELGGGVREGKLPQQLKIRMTDMQDQLNNRAGYVEANITELEKQSKTIPKKIKKIRDKIVRMQDKVVDKVTADSSILMKRQNIQLNDQVFNCRSLVAAITSSCKLLEYVLDRGTETQIFIMVHKLEEQLTEYQGMVRGVLNNTTRVELDLDMSEKLTQLYHCKQQDNLAKVSVKETRLTTDWTPVRLPEHVPIAERQVRKMPLFDIRKTGNVGQPMYNGVVVLPGGQVVATNVTNHMCCTLDETWNMTSHIKLSSCPRSITMIGDTEVAVLLPNENKLQCVSVLPHLTTSRTISLSKPPVCVTRVSDTELAVGWENAGFSIVTMEGKEIRHIERDTSGRQIKFDWSDSITVDVSRQHLFRSSGIEHVVYCCDLTGKTVFDYTNNKLKTPRGLTLDQDGNVYVCSKGTDSVHQISPEGTLIRVIDTGMKEPSSLCFYPHGQQMLVMNWSMFAGTTKALKVMFEPPT